MTRYVCQIIEDENFQFIDEIEAENKDECLRQILLSLSIKSNLDHPYLFKVEIDIRTKEELQAGI